MGNIPQYWKDMIESWKGEIEKEKSRRRRAEAQVDVWKGNAQHRLYVLRQRENQLESICVAFPVYEVGHGDEIQDPISGSGAAKQMIHIQAKRLRAEHIARSNLGGEIRTLREENVKLKEDCNELKAFTVLKCDCKSLKSQKIDLQRRAKNLQAANRALNKALIEQKKLLNEARSDLGNGIEARKFWERSAHKANSQVVGLKTINADYETTLVKMIQAGDKREEQLAEMIKEGEARVEAFERWENELEAPSEESKTEKSKLAKEKRRLLVSMSGYSADVLKTFFNRATPIFIVAIVAIALVKIYG